MCGAESSTQGILRFQMAVDSRSGLAWDHLNQILRSNFSRVLRSRSSSSKDAQPFLNLLALASDAFVGHGIKVLLSGSLSDGSLVNPVLTGNMPDIDLMCIPKSLKISERDQRDMFRDVPSAPGFIWLRVPEPARVKDLVREGKRSKIRLATLKKARNARGKVGHYLVGRRIELSPEDPLSAKNRINLFDEFRRSPFGDLVSSVFGPHGLFFGSVGKDQGAAAVNVTMQARMGPPQIGGSPGRFFLTDVIPNLIEGIIRSQREEEEDEDHDDEVEEVDDDDGEEGEEDEDEEKEGEEERMEENVRTALHQDHDQCRVERVRDEMPSPTALTSGALPGASSSLAADGGDDGATSEAELQDSHGYVNVGGSFDLVPAIECEGWPVKAREFIDREREWPSVALVRRIAQEGFHLVSKGSPEGNKDMEWRISFSVAEKTLFDNLSNLQRECYQIFKSIFYCELSGPEVLKSYHIKTIFLWACERLPAEYWVEDRLAQIIMGLLDDLLHCLETKSCPHYFIPEQNQFAHAPEELLLQYSRKVGKIRSRPDRCPSEEVRQLLRDGLRPGVSEGVDSNPEVAPASDLVTATTSQEDIPLD